jgi:hypothetical protein
MTNFFCHGCGVPIQKTWQGADPKWCSGRCRKRSYGDPCVDCGAKTRYGAETARVAEPRCLSCARDFYRKWLPEKVLDRIVEWTETYGEPPAMADWNPVQSRNQLHDEARAQRFEDANGYWPGFSTVVQLFGSWNEGIRRAGFEPRVPRSSVENMRRTRKRRESDDLADLRPVPPVAR